MPDSQIVDVTYDDPRTGQRIRETRVQEIPFEEAQDVRNNELAVVSDRDADRFRQVDRQRDEDEDVYYNVRRTTREREPTRGVPPLRPYYEDPRYYRSSRPSSDYGQRGYSRRERSRYDDYDDYESSRERDHRRRSRRTRSERRPRGEEDDEGRLWYSGRDRKDANFVEKNFDSSYDGLLAGAAGAAIGALTARHFAEDDKNRRWKTLGAAVAGGAAFNAAENKYRMYTEDRERRGKDYWEGGQPLDFVGQAAQEF